MADLLLESAALTERHRRGLQRLLGDLGSQTVWHGALPVAILDRCWLRLEDVAVASLAKRLPPDSSAEAPELVTYRQWLSAGLTPLEAQERCWQDYGVQACQQALNRFWHQQERGNHGWTLTRYLELLATYRQRLERGKPALPLLILARAGSQAPHELVWLC